MNTDKISKFITKKRKEKKLTQQQLADLTHLSEKTISKWECGRGIPDIGNLQSLSKALDVSVTEILNGEEEEKEQPVIEYIEYKEKKTKKKLLITLIFSTLIMLLIVFGAFFINNYGKTKVYTFSGKGNHFYYQNLLLIKSNSGNILSNGYLGNDYEYDYHDIYLHLKMNNEDYGALSNEAHTYIEKNTGKGLIPEKGLDNLDNWEIIVSYYIGEEQYEETIKLESKEIISGNRFTKEKIDTLQEKHEERNKINIEDCDEIRKYVLEKEGYEVVKNTKDGLLILFKQLNKNESIEIRGFPSSNFNRIHFKYKYSDDKLIVSTNFDQGLGKKYDKVIFSSYLDSNNESFSFRYLVNDNKAICLHNTKCPKNMEEIGKRFVDTIEKEFYELDVFDRNETCNCYQIIRESDEDV